MYKNEEYWNEFYSQNQSLKNASGFCQSNYINNINNYLINEHLIVELGCGSGADSFYLANKGFQVISMAGSGAAIAKN